MGEYKSAKERLKRHLELLKKCKAKQLELSAVYGGIRCSEYTGMPRGSATPGSSPVEKTATRKMNLEQEIELLSGNLEQDWMEIKPLVDELNPMEALVINLRYYHGLEWDEICRKLYAGQRDYEAETERYEGRMYSIHNRALGQLEKTLKNQGK